MKIKSFLAVIFLLSLPSCGGSSSYSSISVTIPEEVDETITLINAGEDLMIHTELQESYILNEDYEDVPKEATGTKELSRPLPIELSWKSEEKANKYEIILSEDESFSSYEYYSSNEEKVEVINLKVSSVYFWKVRKDGESKWSKTSSFSTEDCSIRNIEIEGMTNCRDIGGKTLKSGKKIKQGNIYRTGNADDISEKGKEEARRLGLKTEIDIRDTTIEKSPLGDDIEYHLFHMYYNDYSNYIERNCESIKKVFQVLAKEESYPLFYHCRIGTDRTGLTTYLLYGLLGAEEEDIYRDYLFSNFGNIEGQRTLHGSDVNNVQLYYEAINAFPGETLQEKVYNFLISIGVEESELDNIIRYNVVDVEAEDYSVLKGYRPLRYDADYFDMSQDLSIKKEEDLYYIDMDKKIGSSIELDFTVPYDGDYALYLYGYTNRLTTKASDALKIEADEEMLEVTSKTFSDLHYRVTSGIYVAARYAEPFLKKGNHTITITCLGGSNNPSGYCPRIARMLLIPLI